MTVSTTLRDLERRLVEVMDNRMDSMAYTAILSQSSSTEPSREWLTGSIDIDKTLDVPPDPLNGSTHIRANREGILALVARAPIRPMMSGKSCILGGLQILTKASLADGVFEFGVFLADGNFEVRKRLPCTQTNEASHD